MLQAALIRAPQEKKQLIRDAIGETRKLLSAPGTAAAPPQATTAMPTPPPPSAAAAASFSCTHAGRNHPLEEHREQQECRRL